MRAVPSEPQDILASVQKAEGTITQDGVALEFAKRHADQLRFDHDAGCWFAWDGARWRRDGKRVAFQAVRELARTLSAGADDFAVREIRKAGFASGVERFAQSDQFLAAVAADWDRDLFLLGTPHGTVDLQTGHLRQARQGDMITKSTTVAPDAEAKCPRFLRFLDETFGGDSETIRFIQQYLGSALTGDITEQKLVFGEGKGGNGKGVLINTVMGIMGDYAAVVAMEVLTASKHDRHPTEIASLRGVRLVTASETEIGREWAEARIKALTGGDRIKARFMRQDEFEFTPQFKLFVMGNNRPALRTVDEAMKRRLIVVPFSNDVPKERRDPTLPDRLKDEWPAILRWLIDGCLDWQRNRLICPASVEANTADYFEAQDLIGHFLAEKCDVDPGNPHKQAGSSVLFTAWCTYAKTAGAEPGKMAGFVEDLKRRGVPQKRTNSFRGFTGVQILASATWSDDRDGL